MNISNSCAVLVKKNEGSNAENRDDLWIISAYNGGWFHKVIINSFLAYNKLHRGLN